MTTHESIIIRNVHDDSPLAQAFRVAVGDLLETTFRFMRACMIVPLMLRDRVIGIQIGIASSQQTDVLSNGPIRFSSELVILRVSNLRILTL